MARDYFDESKNKKKKDQKADSKQSQSSSVANNAIERSQKSTFLGGTDTKPKQTSTTTTSATNASERAQERSQKSTFLGGTQTRATSTQTKDTRTASDNAIQRSQRSTFMGGTETKRTDISERRTKRRTLAQAQKSGDFEQASNLRNQMYGSSKRRTQLDKWDRDVADTIEHTVKQNLAAYGRVANTSMRGITLKDRELYFTDEQIKRADQKITERDRRLADRIERETAAIEKAQEGHGYLGKQALSAVSSATGMGMDIATGVPLASMYVRSTGASMGQVQKKADNLRKQLEATGNYSKQELDEMFKNVDAQDLANAMASGGIEVLSELMFQGFGPAAKYLGGSSSIANRIASKLTGKVGGKATSGLFKNVIKGTAEEVAEEEIGGPLQTLAANLIYGNKYQGYNEDAVKRSLNDESNALRSQIRTPEEAQQVAARLSSDSFMEESINKYMESGLSRDEAIELAEMSRDYLTASLSGDVDSMKKYQDAMVDKLTGGENSQKEKFSLQDAIDAAVSTSMMTIATGMPGAISTMQIGTQYKESNGLDAVKKQAEIIKNWGEPRESQQAQAVIDHIENGGDLSGTQVYEIIQKSGEVAEKNKEPEAIKTQMVSREMKKRDLRISPVDEYGMPAPQTRQRFADIVNRTVARYTTLDKIGQGSGYATEDVARGAEIGAAFETGIITSEQVNDLVSSSDAVRDVFEDVTGIDIDQFDSYSEMNEALMAAAANNMVNSARLEQIAWNDEARKEVSDYISSGIGGTGDLAVQNALEAVDPRDRTQFLMTADVARSLYDFARKTDGTWEEARARYREMYPSVNYNSLRDVFNAAKEDKVIAETKAYGKIVKSGDTASRNSLTNAETAYVPGKFTDSRQNKDGGLREESLLKSIARAFGINVNVVDDMSNVLTGNEGNAVLDDMGNPVIVQDNGYYDPGSNTLVINAHPDATRTVAQTAAHELTHHIAIHAPEEYVKLTRYIMDAWYRQDAQGFERAISRTQNLYKQRKNQDLSVEQALEEIIADGAADFNWGDEQFIKDVTVNEPTLADRIIEAIKEVLRKIRSILASGDVIDEASREALYDKAVEFSTVQSLWMNAAQAVRKVRANQAIDEWQDKANKQNDTRLSVTDADYMAAVEALPSEEEDYFGRMVGLREVQKMVDEKAIENGYNIKAYHGTDAEPFNVFDRDKLRHGRQYGDGFYFSPYEEVAGTYGYDVREYYLKANGMTLDELFNRPAAQEHRDFDDREEAHRFFKEKFKQFEENGQGIERFRPEAKRVNGKHRVTYTTIGSFQNNVILVATEPEYIKSAEPITYDDHGNVIPLSQRFNEASQDTRFSISAPVEQVKDLIAVHNLTPDKLRGDFRLGGFPMPSIAVTNQSHEDFGEISLLFGSDTIDPRKDKANKVYSADAWTPTVPLTEYEADYKVSSNAYHKVSDLVGDNEYLRNGLSADLNYQNIENSLKNNGGFDGFISRMMEKPSMQYAFLKDSGKDIEIPLKEGSLQGHGADVWKRIDKAIPELTRADAYNMSYEEAMKHDPIIREILQSDFKEKIGEEKSNKLRKFMPYSDQFAWGKVTNYLADLVKFREDGGIIKVTDTAALQKELNENINRDEFRLWLNNMFEGIIKDQGIRNSRDPFTPSGSSRSFKQLHYPATIDGILRAMKEQGEKNVSSYTSTKTLRADTAKSFKSLDEIRKDKGKLQSLTSDEIDAIYKDIDDAFYSVINSIGEKSSREYDLYAADYIADVMSECAQNGYTRPEQIIKKYKEYDWDVSEEDANNILQLFDAIRNMPVNMFEAKPRRAVGFDEVKAAILPSDIESDIRSELQLMEIPIYEYDSSNEEDRQRVVNQAASDNNLRFSISNEYDEPYMAAVNSGNIEAAQILVEQAAKEAGAYKKDGKTLELHHGTRDQFTVFDIEKSNAGSYGLGHYFGYGRSSSVSASYGNREIQAYLMSDNVATRDSHSITAEQVRTFLEEYMQPERYTTQRYADSTEAWVGYHNDADIVRDLLNWATEFDIGKSHTDIMDDVIAILGVDAMLREDVQYAVVFNNTAIKSADPITYAEDGSVIPLSERFDPSNNDIRYSLPTQDSDGNILTDGQMEYFKNSQARDNQGRLVPVYHTTNMGGFTIFDPQYSQDKRSLFFSSNFRVSQSYSGSGENRFDFKTRQLNSLDDLIDYAKELNEELDMDVEWGDDDYESDALGWEIRRKDNNKYAHFEIADDFGKAYGKWKEMVANNDPKLKEYKVRIGLPYSDEYGEPEIMYFEGDSIEELLDKVSNTNIPHAGYYAVYLNLTNPMVIDGKGANWDAISLNSRIPADTHLEIITDEYLDTVAESDEKSFFNEKKQMKDRGYDYKDSQLYFWDRYQKSKQIRKDAKKARENNIVYIKTETGKRLEAEYSLDGIAKAISDYYGFEEAYPEGVLIANKMLEKIGPGKNGHYYMGATELRQETGETHTTREWAAIAQNEGYDGVIFRDVIDLGSDEFYGDNVASDVYVAFSSNQVKDINNVNPTENPDIRYSLIPEDEAMSKIAYDDAMDNSYELLAYYESQLSNVNPETFDVARAFKEEDVVKFLDALKTEDSVPSADSKFEEDRVRMAKSKEDFFNNVNAKWNDRWVSEGEVLKISSVKSDITNLVKGAMANSNAGVQYRNDIVKKTLIDARLAYQLMKQDRTELASYLLYHSAQRMIDGLEFIQDDTAFKEYKDIRNFLRQYRINAPDEYWENETFHDFRKEYYGRLRIGKGNNNIESVYSDLQDRWPHLFNEAEREKAGLGDAAEDLLLHIGVVVDSNVTPFMEAYSSEEAASLAFELADQLYEIIANGDRVVSLADSYKERFDARTKAMKQRHYEAILRERRIREEGIQKEREKFRAYKERQKEKKTHKEHFNRIEANYKTLCNWVLNPTKEKNVPEEFRKSLAEFLQTLDLQTENSKKLEAKTGHVANKTFKMRELKDRLNALAQSKTSEDGVYIPGGFELDAYAAYIMDMLSDKYDGKPVDELDADAIRDIDIILSTIIKNIQRYKRVKTETKMASLSEIGKRGVEFFKRKVDRDGAYGKRQGLRGTLDTINASALTPAYLFDRMGALKEMYDVLRHNGFDTYIRNEKMIMDRMTEILGDYYKKSKKGELLPGSEAETWRDDRSAQTIELASGESVTMSVAQMMSLYCLSKRGEQALGHMMVGGIVVTPIQTGSKIQSAKEKLKGEKKAEASEKYVLAYEDIQNIISQLSKDQIKVADQLQELMSVDMAKLGNEAHRELYGYEMFGEDNYFPIKVHGNERSTDINNIGEVIEKIKSFGFTKPLTPRAGQAIEIDDIFSVVADHCNGMNLYNAYLVPITDFMKVLNYTHTFENGKSLTMKEAIQQAYGEDMLKYILNLMKDINGIKGENRGGLEGIMTKALGRAKRTAVFGNIRVALQQPTAIVRAAAEINPKYLKGIKIGESAKGFVPTVITASMEEMYKYCPIAQWKAWGYYDTYMGRDIEDVMMNQWSIGDKLMAGYYGQLDNATWAIIWQAVKAEQADKHPKMDHKSEEFLQICGRRASEVFDKTQVVDSTFHRSDAMRSNQVAVKAATAFMAEPTLTLNVLRAGLFNASEASKEGKKGEAHKIRARAISVIVGQAITVSAAQAFADAWRGKDPGLPWDDEDDEEKVGYWWRWIHNFVSNIFDQMHLENNMYLIKDITPYINYMASRGAEHWNMPPLLRAILGWDQDYLYSQNNLVMSSLENTANGVSQIFKKLEKGEEYDKTWYDITQKTASLFGTLTGIPIPTLMRDFKPIWDFIIQETYAADTDLMDKVANKMGYKPIESKESTDKTSVSTGAEAEGETENVPTKESLPENLTDEQKEDIIKSAKKRSEKATPAEEQGQLDYDDMLYKALKAASGLEGEEYNKKVYSSVANGLKGYIADGDYVSVGMMRTVIEQAGGDLEYFDQRVLEETKTAYKKTLKYDPTIEERWDQKAMYRYMMSHGMTQEQLSSEIVSKSDLARDMKVAYRLGDNATIYEAMIPLADAGITTADLQKMYDNRNRVDLVKYKQTGRFKDRLKSTGTFIWPASGTITSHFGYRTDVSSVGGSTDHPAIDIGIPVGTPVVAADGGVVIHAGSNYGYGYSVGIKHDNGMVTYYNHLDSWNVKVGDTVAQGQQIACSGNTGRSTGPHLDFKILDKNGKPVDPEKLLNKES